MSPVCGFFFLQNSAKLAKKKTKTAKSAHKCVKKGDFILLLLLSASVERVSVSRMRDFCFVMHWGSLYVKKGGKLCFQNALTPPPLYLWICLTNFFQPYSKQAQILQKGWIWKEGHGASSDEKH